MKILHVIDSEGYYGAETVLVGLVAEQQRQGAPKIDCRATDKNVDANCSAL